MATPVYSVLLHQVLDTDPSGFHGPFIPPDGFLWVVRDIVATAPAVHFAALNGIEVTDTDGGSVWSVPPATARSHGVYHFHGHQVLGEFVGFNITTGDAAWAVRVSGYQLSLP